MLLVRHLIMRIEHLRMVSRLNNLWRLQVVLMVLLKLFGNTLAVADGCCCTTASTSDPTARRRHAFLLLVLLLVMIMATLVDRRARVVTL